MQATATHTRQPRRDALPENFVYRIEPCCVAPACTELNCPRPNGCIRDQGYEPIKQARQGRFARIIALRQAGLTVKEIMAAVPCSESTVMRALRTLRAQASN